VFSSAGLAYLCQALHCGQPAEQMWALNTLLAASAAPHDEILLELRFRLCPPPVPRICSCCLLFSSFFITVRITNASLTFWYFIPSFLSHCHRNASDLVALLVATLPSLDERTTPIAVSDILQSTASKGDRLASIHAATARMLQEVDADTDASGSSNASAASPGADVLTVVIWTVLRNLCAMPANAAFIGASIASVASSSSSSSSPLLPSRSSAHLLLSALADWMLPHPSGSSSFLSIVSALCFDAAMHLCPHLPALPVAHAPLARALLRFATEALQSALHTLSSSSSASAADHAGGAAETSASLAAALAAAQAASNHMGYRGGDAYDMRLQLLARRPNAESRALTKAEIEKATLAAASSSSSSSSSSSFSSSSSSSGAQSSPSPIEATERALLSLRAAAAWCARPEQRSMLLRRAPTSVSDQCRKQQVQPADADADDEHEDEEDAVEGASLLWALAAECARARVFANAPSSADAAAAWSKVCQFKWWF
jgi:hypothetical protein